MGRYNRLAKLLKLWKIFEIFDWYWFVHCTVKEEDHCPFMKSQSECQRKNLILLVFVQFGLLMMAEMDCHV